MENDNTEPDNAEPRTGDPAAFHHYTSIANADLAAARADLAGVQGGFVVQEKIDGANIQVLLTPGCAPVVGRRNAFLREGEAFYGLWDTLREPPVQAALAALQAHVDAAGAPLRIFGEYFGPGVQRRINYGPVRRILFFDADVGGTRVAAKDFEALLAQLGLSEWAVPKLARMDSLEDALAYDTQHASRLSPPDAPAADTLCEGVVIKPWAVVARDDFGHPVYLKKRNEAFLEAVRAPARRPQDHTVTALREDFKRYLTRNRALSVLSKEGEPAAGDNKAIARLCRALLADARKDYTTDNAQAVASLSKEQAMHVFGKHNVWATMQSALGGQSASATLEPCMTEPAAEDVADGHASQEVVA